MKKLIALFFISAFVAIGQQPYSDMAEESLLIVGSDKVENKVLACKAYVSIGRTLSRIRIKKSETSNTVLSSNDNQYFIRGRMDVSSVQCCLVKLKDKGKTLQAFYSDDLGKKFEFIPITKAAVDKPNKIYSVRVLSILDDGFYAFFFRNKNGGNLMMGTSKLTYKPLVFEIKSGS